MRTQSNAVFFALSFLLFSNVISPYAALAQPNSLELPTQILRTGINLEDKNLSPNGRQVADILKITPLLQRIQTLRSKVNPTNTELTQEDLLSSVQLTACVVDAMQVIQEASLSVDYSLAEITAEENIYTELLSVYAGDRDKATLKTNAASLITNGILWAIAEGYDIPTNRHPNYSVTSGTVGILAGIVPSIASIYALYQLRGKQRTSEKDPNMLSKMFDYPTTPDVDYPRMVWEFMNAVPADDTKGKSRRDQLIDRWIADKNISNFTDRSSAKQLDVITASIPRKHGLSIDTLNARQLLLQQLAAEILKMKRMLLEISMVVHGEKTI
jgi:hypothetical protein